MNLIRLCRCPGMRLGGTKGRLLMHYYISFVEYYPCTSLPATIAPQLALTF